MKEKYQVNNDIVKNNIALNKVNDKIKKIIIFLGGLNVRTKKYM